MCPKLWLREILRFKGNKTNWFPKGATHHTCYVIYSQRMNNLAAIYLKKVFNYFPPSDIPSNKENNKFN